MLLFLLAVVPALYLLYYVYKHDTVEKEPFWMIRKVFFAGVLSAIPAVIIELILDEVLLAFFSSADSILYIAVVNFIGVALVEEFCKRFMVKKRIWNSPEFNYTFDGIIYCVCGAIGFAVIENIFYVIGDENGFMVAIMRALMSVPLHASCGVYMGYYVGLAKKADLEERVTDASNYWRLSLIVPVMIHGAYDFILSLEQDIWMLVIVVFCIVVDVYTIRKMKSASASDMAFEENNW